MPLDCHSGNNSHARGAIVWGAVVAVVGATERKTFQVRMDSNHYKYHRVAHPPKKKPKALTADERKPLQADIEW